MALSPARATADEALRVAEADPGRAIALVSEALRLALATQDLPARVVAERAHGLAAIHREDLDSALRHLRRAVALARAAGLPRLGAEAQMTLAYALNMRGRSTSALREIESAVRDLDQVEGARARAQRGAILHQLGRLDDALANYRDALPALRRAGDRLWTQRVLFNRGVLHVQRREFAVASADLMEAVQLCRELGLDLSVGYALANLGFLHSMRGDVPTALGHFDEAEHVIGGLRAQLGPLLTDRTELLLSARLISEARATAERAVAEFERTHGTLGLPEARLLLARSAAVDGDPALAVQHARRALRELARQHRTDWVPLARLTILLLRAAGGSEGPVPIAAVERALADVAPARWPAAALEGRLLAAHLALQAGRTGRATQHLEIASRSRSRGPALLRARGWYAEGLRRYASGSPAGATRAVRAGLAMLDDHAATFGATDLWAYAAGHRTDLTDLGLRMAFEQRRPLAVWTRAELGRGAHLQLRPVQPPDDDVLAVDLAELRSVAVDVIQLRKAGRSTAAAVQRQVTLERRIRDHVRRNRGGPERREVIAPSVRTVVQCLGQAALVEFVEHEESLYAVTIVDARMRIHHLAPVAEVLDLARRLPFGLGRLAAANISARDRDAALALVADAGRRLDRMLFAGPAETADRPLVLVPGGPLQSFPWATLPSVSARATTIAPSAMLWARAACSRPGTTGHATISAGPELPGAETEAHQVARLYGRRALVGAEASVRVVASAMDGAGVAHLAAHGRIHRHNPLFSSLRFFDGPLMVYDLERLRRAPHTVVLAACDVGHGVATARDELLSLSATFLALGTKQVIASVLPVPDIETAPLMIALHRCLSTGSPAAEALAAAYRETRDDGRAMAMAAGFVCIGAGHDSL